MMSLIVYPLLLYIGIIMLYNYLCLIQGTRLKRKKKKEEDFYNDLKY